MPTDIALSTNTATGTLELRQAQPMPDGSGYAAFLVVRSGGFAAALPYFVTTDAWRGFVAALAGMCAGAGGVARLPARDGDDHIAIAAAGEGLITVSGSLREMDDQSLRFRFATSSRGLDALVEGARRVAEDEARRA